MTFMVPSWLNVEFTEKILRESESDNSIRVSDVSIKPVTKEGENFNSDMLRINVEYTRQENDSYIDERKSFIVKLMPQEDGMRKEVISHSDIFKMEAYTLTDTLIKMNILLKPYPPLSARCLYTQFGEGTLIAMEDLAPQGFRMTKLAGGLDFDHTLLVIRSLARFHGISVTICEKEPWQKEIYHNRSQFGETCVIEMNFYTHLIKTLGRESARWPELDPKYSEKIVKLSDNAYRLCCKYAKMKSDEFNVINHGDTWVNNLMFQYDKDDQPVQHLFVDFQFCNYSSPVIDLMHLFNSSVSPDVYENHQSELLDEYLETLTNIMKHSGCRTEPPTRFELDKMLKERAFYGMLVSITLLPFMLIKKEGIQDVDVTMKEGYDFAVVPVNGQLFRNVITKRLSIYDQMGLLDLK